MTQDEEKALRKFETRVRQLIFKYKALEQEAQELYEMVDERDKTIAQLKGDIAEWEKKYKDLKTARMIEVTSGEREEAQKRIAKLIREIDKCIALINGCSHTAPTPALHGRSCRSTAPCRVHPQQAVSSHLHQQYPQQAIHIK